jgi:Mu-like prophage major head subunit gpT
MIIRGNFSDFYLSTMLPAISRLIGDRYRQYPTIFTRIFNTDSSSRSIEQFSGISGVGLAAQIDEGTPVRQDLPVQGFDSTFTHTKHGLSIPITKETVSDDKFGLVKKMTRSLVRSIKETRELRAASHFNNGFSGSFLGPDGKSLFASDHPLYKSGGAQSNILSAAADLSPTSLQLALTDFYTMKTPEGFFQMVPAKNLVYAPANHFNAVEIVKSDKRSDTANNATNALKEARDGLPELIMWPHLSDPDAWFLTSDPDDTGLVWIDREKPYTDRWYDELAETMYEIMRYRASSGWNDFNGAYGTPGA